MFGAKEPSRMLVMSWYTNFHYILYRLKTDAIKDAIRTYNNKGNYSVEYLTKEVRYN